MTRKGWAIATGCVAIIAAVAIPRPHRVTAAAAPAPQLSESEIRTADIAFYEKRVVEDSFSAADRSRLASLYLQRARETGSYVDYDRAATISKKSLELREGHNQATYVVLASALLAKHEFSDALAAARRLYSFDTTDAGHTALLAEVELEVGEYDSAATHFRAVARDADKPSIAARLARWYELTGHLDRARGILQRTSSKLVVSADVPREQVAWFHYRLGELYLRGGMLVAADSAYHRALAALPDDYRALGGLTRLSVARGDYKSAVEHGARAIAIQLDPATLGTMSDAYAALGDTAQARSFADAMATSALSQPGAIHRAWGLFLLDHDRDASRVLREARADIAHRHDVYGYDLLAWAAFKAGRIAEADSAIKLALSQNTEDAMLLYHASQIAAAAGDSARASSLRTTALALNPKLKI
jgi:tetratricopeptide (TPR) repeat protein